ncbi:MAG: NAD+ synthase, partial [Betaproteobacteria bacterium]|nr:NAD+ synthase [Betaproteobacteria bacterium]
EEVTFVDVECFGPRAEAVGRFFSKGRPIFVEGRLKLDQWESKDGEKRSAIRVVLDNFEFVDALDGQTYKLTKFDKEFIKKQELAFSDFQPFLKNKLLIIGGVLLKKNKVFNSAFIISHNNIKHQHKQCLPNYGVFDEKRYFSAGDNQKIISYKSKKILILICEDFWDKDLEKKYQDKKIDFCIVINASPFEINKLNVRINRAKKINKKIKSNLIYLNMVGGQDDVVFDGASFLLNKNNNISCQLNHFKCQTKLIEESSPQKIIKPLSIEESVLNACILGTKDYIKKNKIKNVFIGLSGGIDSALVAYIASKATNKKNINCIMMRSQYTSKMSIDDAKKLAKSLEVNFIDRNLSSLINQINLNLKDDFKNFPTDITEENIQARIRGLILMAMANKKNGIVLSTSNKSESAVGYSTLYGDMVGAYAPIKDVPKTLIYKISEFINLTDNIIPERIINRPPSAELKPDQTDQDSLPTYEELDKIIELFIDEGQSTDEIVSLGFKSQTVKKIVKLILRSEFKRRQSPPGPKITRKAFGRERRFPITNNYLG